MIFDEYRNPRPAGVTAPPTAPVAPPAAKRSARGVGGAGPNFLSPVPQAPQILLNQTNPTNAAMVANGQNPFHPIPNVNAPAFTTSPGAAPRTNGVPFVMPPDPIAATTSPGAAPPAAPAARPAATPFSGDPMNPTAQRVLPNTVEAPPKPITGGPMIPGTEPKPAAAAPSTAATAPIAKPGAAYNVGRTVGATVRGVAPSLAAGLGGALLANQTRDIGNPANQPSGNATMDPLVAQIPTGGVPGAGPTPATQPYNFYTDTETGRNVGNIASAASAIPGVGPAMRVAAPLVRGLAVAQGFGAQVRADREGQAPAAAATVPAATQAPAPAAAYTETAGMHSLASTEPRDLTNELNKVPQNLPSDIRKGAIYKTVDPKTGQPTYSGIDVAANAQMVDGKGATTAQRGGVTTLDMSEGRAQVQRELARIDADKAKEATRMDEQELAAQMQAGNTTAARAIRGRMKRQAEKTAAATTAAATGETQKLARDKFNLDAQGAALDNKGKARLGVLQDAVFNAKTPKDQAAAEDKLRAFQGKYEKQATDEYAYAPGGQEVDPATGTTVTRPGVIFNKRTGEVRPQASANTPLPPKDKLVKGQQYNTPRGPAVWDGSKFVSG